MTAADALTLAIQKGAQKKGRPSLLYNVSLLLPFNLVPMIRPFWRRKLQSRRRRRDCTLQGIGEQEREEGKDVPLQVSTLRCMKFLFCASARLVFRPVSCELFRKRRSFFLSSKFEFAIQDGWAPMTHKPPFLHPTLCLGSGDHPLRP